VDGLFTGGLMPSVDSKNMSFEKALRIFRRKCDNAGIKDRCREKEYYLKPNVKRNQANNYRKRGRKLEAEKALQLELRKKLSMRNRG
jgi:ribosomal protein S21